MWSFFIGSATTMALLKITGYATISWMAVFAPIYLPFLVLLAIILALA